jgi:predicted ATPase/DNA-binding CsgD family transcriptional regulator/class 3 adenylate cyclase
MQTVSTTFLFAEPANSLKLREQSPEAMQACLLRFRHILHEVTAAKHGVIFNQYKDIVQAAFPSAPDAMQAALEAQRLLLAEVWDFHLQPRLVLLTGSAQRDGSEFLGQAPHHTGRLLSVANPGQVLLCHITADLMRDSLPEGVTLLDLGEYHLADLTRPERIFQLAASGLEHEFPPLKSFNNWNTNLPSQTDMLVGRQEELISLNQLLRSDGVRLLTLIGIGGTGKTRLALQAAADLLPAFPDGVFFAPLDQLDDPSLVASAVARSLSLDLTGSQPIEDQLKNHLRVQRSLLVLDNFEHLLPATAFVAGLLAACTQLKILVTSREALRLRGEREFPVTPLSLPDPGKPVPVDQLLQFAAVALFIQRAQAVRPDFRVDIATAPAIAEICACLDGLPLAIEIIAARVRLFSPPALLARLKVHPDFQLLSPGARDLPVRQQTLQKAIEWSYNLLNSEEQALFRRLGIFAGGFTIEAVEVVCYSAGELPVHTLETLESLIEKSLVRSSEDESGQIRFSLLFVVRQFAVALLEKVGELNIFYETHAAYYLSLAEQAAPELRANNQPYWLSILERENDNFRAILRWAITDQKAEIGLKLASSFYRFWWQRCYLKEGLGWAEQVLSIPDAQNISPHLYADVLFGASIFTELLGDFTKARLYGEQCLKIRRGLENRRAIAASLESMGQLLYLLGEVTPASQFLEESIHIFREIGDNKGLSDALNTRSLIAMDQGDNMLARSLLEESLKLMQDVEDRYGIGYALSNLGILEMYQGNFHRSKEFFEQGYQIFQDLGNQFQMIITRINIANVLLFQGNLASARSNLEHALIALHKAGTIRGFPEALELLAGVAAYRRNPERAARIFGVCEALRDRLHMTVPDSERILLEPIIMEVRSQMSEADFSKAWSAGRQMLAEGLDQVVVYALEPDEIPGKPSRKSSPAGMTAREAEILRLLAQGLTDIQIAETLFISPRTVNAHLTSIYSKLGVKSRATATRFAVEHGLA